MRINSEEFRGSVLASNSQYSRAERCWKEVPVRTRRPVVYSTDPFSTGAHAGSAPIFAVFAREPVFSEIARDAHARFLANGRLDNAADAGAFQEWLSRADLGV
jgi:hypothetical protein